MSGGPIGGHLCYWANIQISGDLSQQQLQDIKDQITAILDTTINGKKVGKIVSEARASDQNSQVTFNVTYS
jgi:hypothetical protein